MYASKVPSKRASIPAHRKKLTEEVSGAAGKRDAREDVWQVVTVRLAYGSCRYPSLVG